MNSGAMETGWYSLKQGAPAGQQSGPHTWGELYAQAQSGTLVPDDLVWNPQLPQWTPAAQIPGLVPVSAAPSASIPVVSAAVTAPTARTVTPPPLPAWARTSGPATGYAGAPAPPPLPQSTRRPSWLLPVLIPLIAIIIVGVGLGLFRRVLRQRHHDQPRRPGGKRDRAVRDHLWGHPWGHLVFCLRHARSRHRPDRGAAVRFPDRDQRLGTGTGRPGGGSPRRRQDPRRRGAGSPGPGRVGGRRSGVHQPVPDTDGREDRGRSEGDPRQGLGARGSRACLSQPATRLRRGDLGCAQDPVERPRIRGRLRQGVQPCRGAEGVELHQGIRAEPVRGDYGGHRHLHLHPQRRLRRTQPAHAGQPPGSPYRPGADHRWQSNGLQSGRQPRQHGGRLARSRSHERRADRAWPQRHWGTSSRWCRSTSAARTTETWR